MRDEILDVLQGMTDAFASIYMRVSLSVCLKSKLNRSICSKVLTHRHHMQSIAHQRASAAGLEIDRRQPVAQHEAIQLCFRR